MKLTVHVKTNSKVESVELAADGRFLVKVNTPPVDGKANKRVQELLAKHLNIPKTSLRLVSGLKSKIKTFEY